jgi:competence protein ComEC
VPPIPGIFDGEIKSIVSKKANFVSFIAEGTFSNKFTGDLQCVMFIRMNSNDENKIFKLLPSARIQAELNASIPEKKQIRNEFDQRAYSTSNGIDFIARVEKGKLSILNYNNRVIVFLNSIRQIIQAKIDQNFSELSSGVATAILTGDKSKLSPEIRDNFSKSGTAHLLAVSGLHVGIIAIILFVVLGFLKKRFVRLFLFLLLMWCFIFLTGASPPGIRAGIFASVYAIMKFSQNRVNPLNVLGITGILVILFEPRSMFSASFQMSFASVFGIIVFYNLFRQTFIILINNKSITTPIINSLSLTLAAGVTVSPIVAYYFGIHSIVSPLANLFAVPMMTLALVYSLIGIIMSFILSDIGNIFCNSAEFFINLINDLNAFMVSNEFAYVSSEYVLIISLLISALMIYVLLSNNVRKLFTRFGISVIFFILTLKYLPTAESNSEKIILRKDFVVYMNDIAFKRYIYILDRKPSIFPRNDHYLNEFLVDFRGDIVLGYTGNCGINIADYLREFKAIKEFQINSDIEKQLNTICNNGNDFVKRIQYYE